MAKGKVSVAFTQELIASVISLLLQIEALLKDLISLEPKERAALIRYGKKNESFARGALRLMEQNPNIIPPSFDLAEAQADLLARDQLAPIQEILRRMTTRVDHTMGALGHDVMVAALDGYALLKVTGDKQGLEELRKDLGTRFAKRRKSTPEGTDSEE